MTDYERGYQDGLTHLAIDKLMFAMTGLESAAHWVERSIDAGAFRQGDRLRASTYIGVMEEELASLRKSMLATEVS